MLSRIGSRASLIIAGVTLIVVASIFFLFPIDRGPQHRYLHHFGSERLNNPVGIAAGNSRVYVADAGNHQIQVFDLEGNWITSFGKRGSALGEFNRPMHITLAPDGNLFVADYLNDRIQVLSPEGVPLYSIGSGGSGPGEFNAPAGVAVDAQGNLYVADFFNHRIQKLDKTGVFIRQWGETGVKGFFSRDKFNYPTDVTMLHDGTWIANDAYNDRIKHYDQNGNIRSVWGGVFGLNTAGPFRGWFNVAIGSAATSDNRVYVADLFNGRVQVMSANGTYYTQFGKKGRSPGEFDRPVDVAFGPQKQVYVLDLGNNRVQVWTIK